MNPNLAIRLLVVPIVCAIFNAPIYGGGVVSHPSEAELKAAVADGGLVTFSFDGTITITSPLLLTANTTIDATGHHITLDALGNVRLAAVFPGVSATLKSLELFNGADRPEPASISSVPDALGGGIVNQGGNLTIESCLFFGNQAEGYSSDTDPAALNQLNSAAYGGAIFSEGGSLHLRNSAFVDNRAIGASSQFFDGKGGYGGAIAMHGGILTIESCTFDSNEARGGPTSGNTHGGAGVAGALLTWETTAQINRSAFQNNYTTTGRNGVIGDPAAAGAIWNGGYMTLLDSIVSNNSCTSMHADAYGGAICTVGPMQINRCSIASNTAQAGESTILTSISDGYSAFGGAIYSDWVIDINNSSLFNNLAHGGHAIGFSAGPAVSWNSGSNRSGAAAGGALFVSRGFAPIESTTFALNRAVRGSVSYNFQSIGSSHGDDIYTQPADVRAHNSIFASVNPDAISDSIYGLVIDDGYNIAIDSSAGFTNPSSLNHTDPKFGVPTATYIPLTAESPAVDSADPSFFPAMDQIWTMRPLGQGPDRGAIEFH